MAEVMKVLGVRATKLSRDLGHAPNYVHLILNGGNQNPDDGFYEYMNARYNISIEWLRSGKGKMFGPEGMKNNYAAAAMVREINTLTSEHQHMLRVYVEALHLKEKYDKEKARKEKE